MPGTHRSRKKRLSRPETNDADDTADFVEDFIRDEAESLLEQRERELELAAEVP